MVKIFVINISDERWERYKDDERFTRWKGVDGRQLDMDFINENYTLMWNANESHKRSVAGCGESHLSLLRHIYENQINNVLIVEDDTIIDFDRLSEIKDIKKFCYLGGRFQSPQLKKKLCRENISVENGLNKININHFTITGGHAYYIPTYDIAESLYINIMSRTKRRAIDAEFRRLQKGNKITDFIYPAIVELHLPTAMNGFTYNASSNYKLKDTNKYY
jgi:GR25 family glycosyltransferase involved in LPS biosynthesis